MTRFDRWGYDGMPTGAEAARVQRNISSVMRDVLSDRLREGYRDPAHPIASPTVTVASAPRATETFAPNTSGWREPAPLAPPPGQDAIERLANEMLPHGREWKAGSAVSPEQSRRTPLVTALAVDCGEDTTTNKDGRGVLPIPEVPGSVASRGYEARVDGGREGRDGYDVASLATPAGPKRRKLR